MGERYQSLQILLSGVEISPKEERATKGFTGDPLDLCVLLENNFFKEKNGNGVTKRVGDLGIIQESYFIDP